MTRALLGAGLLVAVLAGALAVMPRPAALRLLDEGGPLEILQLVLYGIAVLLALRAPGVRPRAKGWIVSLLLLLALLELNPGGVLKTLLNRTPARVGDPVALRPEGVLLVGAVIGGAMLGLGRSAGRGWLAALRARRADAWLVLAGLALVPTAFLLDRFHDTRLVWNQGYRVWVGPGFAAHLAEELAEVLTPVGFVAAALARRRRGNGKETS